MRSEIIAAAVAAVLLAAPAFAEDRTCKAQADGANDASVEVDFSVDASGAVTARSATWSPPAKAGGVAEILNGAPNVTIDYGHPTATGIGPATELAGFSMFMAPDSAVKGGVFIAILDGDESHKWTAQPMIAVATSDKGKPPMTMAMGTMGAETSDSGPVNPDFLAALDTAKSVRIGYVKDGQTVGKSTEVDISDHAARDALFHKAWDGAVKAAQTPKRCAK